MKIAKYIIFLLAILLGAYLGNRFLTKPTPQAATLYVINVLDKDEYEDCHIKGSVQVALEDVPTFVKDLNKQTELVIYCSNYWCSASGQVAQQLMNLGFKNVWAYEAGMAEWYQQQLPVVGPCAASYLTKKIENPQQEIHVPVITTQELKEKMEKAGLI